MTSELVEVLIQSVRAAVLIGLPFLGALIAAAIAANLLQNLTAIREPIITFSLKLLACVGVIYILLPRFTSMLVSLTQLAYR